MCVYVYVYTYMYICVYIHVCIYHKYACIYVYVMYMYICIHICVYTYVCVCVNFSAVDCWLQFFIYFPSPIFHAIVPVTGKIAHLCRKLNTLEASNSCQGHLVVLLIPSPAVLDCDQLASFPLPIPAEILPPLFKACVSLGRAILRVDV